jgi:hypothetical protein
MWKFVEVVGTLVLMVVSGVVAYATALMIMMELGTKVHGNYEYYGYTYGYLALILLYGLGAIGFLLPGVVVWCLRKRERPWQFGLRTLFIGTTLIGLVLVIGVLFFSWLW